MAEVHYLTDAERKARALTGSWTKRCSHCRELKRRFEFNLKRRNKDGVDYYCRDCRKKFTAESYEKRRAKYIADKAAVAERKANGEPVKIKPPEKREPLNDSSVVDSARLVLSQNGWTTRRLAIADLNEVMTEANRILHGDRKPQLGRNPAWFSR